MPLRSTTVSRVLSHGFSPPLNLAVENTTCTLRTDTDINESWDLTHITVTVISAIKTKHPHYEVAWSTFVDSRRNASEFGACGSHCYLAASTATLSESIMWATFASPMNNILKAEYEWALSRRKLPYASENWRLLGHVGGRAIDWRKGAFMSIFINIS